MTCTSGLKCLEARTDPRHKTVQCFLWIAIMKRGTTIHRQKILRSILWIELLTHDLGLTFNTGPTTDRKGGIADQVQKSSCSVFLMMLLENLRTEIAPRTDCWQTENFVEGFLDCVVKKEEELPTNTKPCKRFCGLSSWHASHD